MLLQKEMYSWFCTQQNSYYWALLASHSCTVSNAMQLLLPPQSAT